MGTAHPLNSAGSGRNQRLRTVGVTRPHHCPDACATLTPVDDASWGAM